MLFLLDIILLCNLLFAIKYFKNIASPPVLLGAGMLAAALMASSYYIEWDMDNMQFKTLTIIGGGTVFFTICCMFFSKFYGEYHLVRKNTIDFNKLKWDKINSFLKFSIVIGVLAILLKLYFLRSHFGSVLSISELIVARRNDEWTGSNEFALPSWVRQLGSYTSIISYFSIWLWVLLLFIPKKIRNKKTYRLVIAHVVISFFDGLFSGSKAPAMSMALRFVVFYIYNYYSANGSFLIKKKLIVRILLAILLVAMSFRGLSLLIGRAVENRTNSDLLAEYCGAEIKNFDIFISQNRHYNTKKWGENTFYAFYEEIDPTYFHGNQEFHMVGNYHLGNVYTMYRPYYEDFGVWGVCVMCFLMAFISMYIYRKTFKSISQPIKLNVFLLMYSSIALSLFMSFFSGKFTESICRLGWVKSMLYVCIMVFLFKKYIYINDGKK